MHKSLLVRNNCTNQTEKVWKSVETEKPLGDRTMHGDRDPTHNGDVRSTDGESAHSSEILEDKNIS